MYRNILVVDDEAQIRDLLKEFLVESGYGVDTAGDGNEALQKLENGSYGTCDECGKPIGEERLQIAPFATLCIDCKRLQERSP